MKHSNLTQLSRMFAKSCSKICTSGKNSHLIQTKRKSFYARQHAMAYMSGNSVRPSIRLSVTRVLCIKTDGHIIEILSPF